MPEIVLHIGASKCGSSALQTALTAAPVIENQAGARLSYAVIRSGELFIGSEVQVGGLGYASSNNTEMLNRLSDATLARMGQRLRETDADKVVLSCEGWFTASTLFRERLLPALGIAPQVLAYVRPQIDYLNAAWWQWGAWQDGHPFDDWLYGRIKLAQWARTLMGWKEFAPVIVRPLPKDVVTDFFGIMGFESPVAGKAVVNRGLPEAVLRLYQRNRLLRPSSHASQMDFVLSQSLNLPGGTPWVITQDTAAWAIEKARQDNLRLLSLLDDETRVAMEADLRWWSADAYRDKVVKEHGAVPPDLEELTGLYVELAKAALRPRDDASGTSVIWNKVFRKDRSVPTDVEELEASCVRMAMKILRQRRGR